MILINPYVTQIPHITIVVVNCPDVYLMDEHVF